VTLRSYCEAVTKTGRPVSAIDMTAAKRTVWPFTNPTLPKYECVMQLLSTADTNTFVACDCLNPKVTILEPQIAPRYSSDLVSTFHCAHEIRETKILRVTVLSIYIGFDFQHRQNKLCLGPSTRAFVSLPGANCNQVIPELACKLQDIKKY
jgi:hypothetical protein